MTALELRFDSDAGDDLSIREYLTELLIAVWVDQDEFSGKRPFGNSGWNYDLYVPLIKAGYITGRLDSGGYVADVDDSEAREYVRKLIVVAMGADADTI